MEHHQPHEEPRDIEVFLPRSVELIDPAREQFRRQAAFSPRFRSRKRLALILFVVTCLSTFLAGSNLFVAVFVPDVLLELHEKGLLSDLVLRGAKYAAAVMLILTAHEMGHYLQSRRYHVPASLPYFIPMPLTPIGTMGAVIIQGGHVADRKQLFDIAISGPLAGLVFALPIAWIGVWHGEIKPLPADHNVLIFGDPLILRWMAEAIHGTIAPGEEIVLGPLGFAGWVGIFITGLNLIPIGQFDGGHILYTLIGKRAHWVARGLLLGAVGYMLFMKDPSYILIVLLLFFIGPDHPPTRDDTVPLGTFRVVLGWLTLGFIIVGFTPTPIVQMPG